MRIHSSARTPNWGDNYLTGMAGSVLGNLRNVAKKPSTPVIANDSDEGSLTGANSLRAAFCARSAHRCTRSGRSPCTGPPQSLLVANPIDRYLVNSPMLPGLI